MTEKEQYEAFLITVVLGRAKGISDEAIVEGIRTVCKHQVGLLGDKWHAAAKIVCAQMLSSIEMSLVCGTYEETVDNIKWICEQHVNGEFD